MISYIEQQWTSGYKECTDNVMDRVIRSHSYYTAFLNAAGPADGFCNPQMKRWSLCIFICAPWKAVVAPTEIINWFFVNDITGFWFKDEGDEFAGANGQETVDLVVNQQAGSAENVQSNVDAITPHSISSPGDIATSISESVSKLKKTADPDSFPPNFVRNRLEMFEDEFPLKKEWITMHRGYHIYKDFLADYYRVCLLR